MEAFGLRLTLEFLGWPLGLGLADTCRAWKSVVLFRIQALAAARYVPVDATVPRAALVQFWRRAGYLDASRFRSPWVTTREGPGLHLAVQHICGRWRPEVVDSYLVSRQDPVPDVFPEKIQWLLDRGTFVEWRSWRAYRLSTVPRHELLDERWDVSLTVDGFRWQLSHVDHSLLRIEDSPDPSVAQDEARDFETVKRNKLLDNQQTLTVPPMQEFRSDSS